jgi:hypothetical protein
MRRKLIFRKNSGCSEGNENKDEARMKTTIIVDAKEKIRTTKTEPSLRRETKSIRSAQRESCQC